MTSDDRLDQLLTGLDPAHGAAPVIPGSTTYERLHAAATGASTPADPADGRTLRRNLRGRRSVLASLAAAAVAAVVAVVAVVASLVLPPAPQASAVLAAADRLAAAGTGHIEATWVGKDGDRDFTLIAVGDFAGADIRFDSTHHIDRPTPQTGTAVSREEFISVAGKVWVRREGSWQLEPPGEPLQPYAEASAALVRALAAGPETGRTEGPDGTTSYRIVVDEAARAGLRALRPGEQSWFDMENPDKVTAATITLTGDVVTGIRVEYQPGWRVHSYTARISDLGTPVTITPPPASEVTHQPTGERSTES